MKNPRAQMPPMKRQRLLHAYHDELEWDPMRSYVERRSSEGRILFVENVAVDIDQIVARQFVCDGRRCVVWRGENEDVPLVDRSCCSRYGVPITREGETRIYRHLEAILKELPDDHPLHKAHAWDDVFEYDDDDQRSLRMSDNLGACVFRLYENGHSLCAVHKAALTAGQNPVDWKPITCLLWPLAVDRYENDEGQTVWFLSVYCEDTDGVFEQNNDIADPVACIEDDDATYPYVYESMRPELEHVFGREWYIKLLKAIEKQLEVSVR